MPEKFGEQFFKLGGASKETEKPVEIMKTPEIAVQPEKGINLMSVIMKGYNPEWGNREHDLAKMTEQYFFEHPLDPKIKNTIEALNKEGVDEESLYYLSLTYQHPERKKAVFDVLGKYKEIKNPEGIQQKLLESLELLNSSRSFKKLEDDFAKYTQEDIAIKEKQLGESRQKIEGLIGFFKPKTETTAIKRVSLMPTDFLYHKKSGKSFGLGEELLLMAPREDSTAGQAHEFLHGVVNPIVDKLDKNLTSEQKREITQLTSGKIRQHYGQDEKYYFSHLCEGFIRTYINNFKKEKPIPTHDNFKELVSQNVPDEKRFQEILAEDKELKQRCEALNISSLGELNDRSKEYFDTYERDRLGEIIYGFYQDYKEERLRKSELTFEDFVLQKFTKHLNYETENPPTKEALEILQRRRDNLRTTLRVLESDATEQTGDFIKSKDPLWKLADWPEIKREFWKRERRVAATPSLKTVVEQAGDFEKLSPSSSFELKGEILDGFRVPEESISVSERARAIREGLSFAEVVVDRKADKKLSVLCKWAKELKKEVPDEEERIFYIAQKVFKKMGGVKYEKIEKETEKIKKARKPVFLGEINFGECRQRALLVQTLAAEAGLSSSLMFAHVKTRVFSGLHAYNEVDLKNGEVVVVDAMNPFFGGRKKKFGDLTYEGFKKEGGFPRFGSNKLPFDEYWSLVDRPAGLLGGRLGARALRQLLDVNLEAI